MPLPRAHCAVAVCNGKLIVAGGTYWSGKEKIWSERVDYFDPVSNRWETLDPLPYPHAEGACVAIGPDPIILGGSTKEAMSSMAWSFRGGAWLAVPAMALPAPRRWFAAAAAGGSAYVIGGFGLPNDMGSPKRTVWAWEAGGKGWEERAPLPGAARFWPAVAAIGRKIFMAGGATIVDGRLENLDDIIVYDPAIDRWSSMGRLPFACRGASGLAVDEKLLIIGGYGETFGRHIFSLDPQTGQITPAGSLPWELAFSNFVSIDRRIFGVGGENEVTIRVPWTPIEASL